TITSFSPALAAVGATVTVFGTNLNSVTDVSFNGTPAGPITVVSATSIKVNVPTGATTGKISVTNRAGTALSVGIFKVIPKITSFTPANGIATESVTISGLNLKVGGTTPTVKFGTGIATVTSSSDTEIVATIPSTGITGKLMVTTADGTGISPTDFIVIKPPTVTTFTPVLAP